MTPIKSLSPKRRKAFSFNQMIWLTLISSLSFGLTVAYGLTVWLLTIGLQRTKPGQNTSQPTVTVVVAARNEEANIGCLLDSLCHQSYANYRIIVVDDRSTDRTGAIVRQYQNCHDCLDLIRIDHVPAGFAPKKYALHTAILSANSDLILTTDADCMCPPVWIERMVQHFEDGVGLVIGLIHYQERQQTFLQKWQVFDFFALMCSTAATAQLGMPFAGAGPSLGYRRELYQKVDGFGPYAHRISGDDVMMIQRIRHLNTTIRFLAEPDAAVLTSTQINWRSFFWQRQRWASNSGLQWRLNKRFFAFLVLVFAINILCWLLPLLMLVEKQVVWSWLLLLTTKLVVEFQLLRLGAAIFKRDDLLSFFPAWFITHPFYVTIMGVVGPLGKIRWK